MNEIKEPGVINRLEKLGFKAASTMVKELAVRKRKMAIAYEHHRFVRPEKIVEFNKKLREKSLGDVRGYQMLTFTPIEQYSEVPPASVLDSLEVAMGRQCFDSFEIAHIINVKDPIIFGRIEG